MAGRVASETKACWSRHSLGRSIDGHTSTRPSRSSPPPTPLEWPGITPFTDGNKRTALMAAYIFLARNGYRPTMTEADTVVVMRALAAGELDEPELTAWFTQNSTQV